VALAAEQVAQLKVGPYVSEGRGVIERFSCGGRDYAEELVGGCPISPRNAGG
jgi:hypothetical protein